MLAFFCKKNEIKYEPDIKQVTFLRDCSTRKYFLCLITDGDAYSFLNTKSFDSKFICSPALPFFVGFYDQFNALF